MKRVMVFTMHETDRAKAVAALVNHSTTDGYVVGDADEATIQNLQKQGLIVTEVESPPAPTAVLQGAGGGAAKQSFPAYFTAWLQKPVLPEYHAQLDAAGLQLQEARGSRHVFRVQDQAQLAKLEALPFVTEVKPFDREETLKTKAKANTLTARWDLMLHDGASVADLRKYLDVEGIKVIAQTPHKIQIQAGEDDAEACGERVEVAAVLPWRAPTLRLDRTRALVGADAAAQVANGGLTGKGVVVGVCDSGLDETHVAFATKERILIARGREKDASDPHGHGTHVAGTICGDPKNPPNLAGIAPAAKLVFQSVMDENGSLTGIGDDLIELLQEAYDSGARIHNNSWGADVGGAYMSSSFEVDRFIWENPDMLVVIAAGNAGSIADPPAGPRRSLAGEVEWFSVGAPGTSKNALVVGASRSDRQQGGWAKLTFKDVWPDRFAPPAIMAADTVSGDPTALAAFSSRGPSDDQRIKPDVVAPGTDIAAPRASTAPSYRFAGMVPNTNRAFGYMSGTSMATPIASGLAALLREYLVRERKVQKPSAALMKAILINGTRTLAGSGTQTNPPVIPNPHQGFGCLDLSRSIPIDPAKPFELALVDSWSEGKPPFMKKDSKTRRRFQFTTTKKAPLRVTLAYTDHYSRGVQNNLNLVLEPPKGTPLIANADLPQLLKTNLPDPTNNVETVKLDDAAAGTWTVTIFAATMNFEPQHYALAVAGALTSDQLMELP